MPNFSRGWMSCRAVATLDSKMPVTGLEGVAVAAVVVVVVVVLSPVWEKGCLIASSDLSWGTSGCCE
jgi:hypothetical protein